MNQQINASKVLSFLKQYKEEIPDLVRKEDFTEIFSYHFNGALTLQGFYDTCGEDFRNNSAFIYLTGILSRFKLMRDKTCPSRDKRQISDQIEGILNKLPWITPSLESLAKSKSNL